MIGRIKRAAAQAKKALRRAQGLMMDYAFAVTLIAVVAVVVASAMYTQHMREQGNVQAAASAPEVGETPSPAPSAGPAPTVAPLEIHSMELKPGGSTVWPVSGSVIRAHDAQKHVLWEALSCIQVHTGVDIAGTAEETVLCVMDGVVEQAVRDDLWGWRVRVAQTDGEVAEYAGLLLCSVSVGQSVTRGQALGQLLETIPCESELGTHLHLSLTREGEAQDPMTIMPE